MIAHSPQPRAISTCSKNVNIEDKTESCVESSLGDERSRMSNDVPGGRNSDNYDRTCQAICV